MDTNGSTSALCRRLFQWCWSLALLSVVGQSIHVIPMRLLSLLFGVSNPLWNDIVVPMYASSFLSTRLSFVPASILPIISIILSLYNRIRFQPCIHGTRWWDRTDVGDFYALSDHWSEINLHRWSRGERSLVKLIIDGHTLTSSSRKRIEEMVWHSEQRWWKMISYQLRKHVILTKKERGRERSEAFLLFVLHELIQWSAMLLSVNSVRTEPSVFVNCCVRLRSSYFARASMRISPILRLASKWPVDPTIPVDLSKTSARGRAILTTNSSSINRPVLPSRDYWWRVQRVDSIMIIYRSKNPTQNKTHRGTKINLMTISMVNRHAASGSRSIRFLARRHSSSSLVLIVMDVGQCHEPSWSPKRNDFPKEHLKRFPTSMLIERDFPSLAGPLNLVTWLPFICSLCIGLVVRRPTIIIDASFPFDFSATIWDTPRTWMTSPTSLGEIESGAPIDRFLFLWQTSPSTSTVSHHRRFILNPPCPGLVWWLRVQNFKGGLLLRGVFYFVFEVKNPEKASLLLLFFQLFVPKEKEVNCTFI